MSEHALINFIHAYSFYKQIFCNINILSIKIYKQNNKKTPV